MLKGSFWSTTKFSPREMHYFKANSEISSCGRWQKPKDGDDVIRASHEESEQYNLCRACNYPFTIMFAIGGWYGSKRSNEL